MRSRAFSLVEALVVVALISLLIAMLMPSLGRAREAARRAVCLSQLHQLHVTTVSYAIDFSRRMPHRVIGSSGYAGGFHNDNLPAAHAGHWGRQWTNYIPDLEFDGQGSHLLFCPSMDNPRKAWRPTFQPIWRNADYAYWPTMNVPLANSGGIIWKPAIVPSGSLSGNPLLPMWGDSIMEYWYMGKEWFVSGHPRGGRGHNSYAENTSQAERPEGGNQVCIDGSGGWNNFESMQPAIHMVAWGAIAGKAFQYWAFNE